MKELFLPFIYSLLVIVFLLFTNFLLRAIDRFLGKGLDLLTILEYLVLNLAWIIALSVPMAVLIATLMTFGRMSEDNEITAIRTSGISFLTILRPALSFGIIICILLILFNNILLPEMNFRARILSGDIYRKKPGLTIDPGHFIDDLPGYSMIIREKQDTLMKDVRIFSKENTNRQISITAKTGEIQVLNDAIVLTLNDGEIHELELKDYANYQRIAFKKNVFRLAADDLMLMRRDTSSRTDREMTLPMMQVRREKYKDRIERIRERLGKNFYRSLGDSIVPPDFAQAELRIKKAMESLDANDSMKVSVKDRIKSRLTSLQRLTRSEYQLIDTYKKNYNRYGVEVHKKFSLPVAAVLFVLVGAPLGVLARKGGLVVGISLSFGFFLLYYIFMISGEEMADRGIVTPLVGMWTPNLILLVIALYLAFHTVREKAPISADWAAPIDVPLPHIKAEESSESIARPLVHGLRFFTGLIMLSILIDLPQVLTMTMEIRNGFPLELAAEGPFSRMQLITLWQLRFFILSMVFFFIWARRAYKIAMKDAPGMKKVSLFISIFWSLTPGLNLFGPYFGLNQLWKRASYAWTTKAGLEERPSSSIVLWWWILLLLYLASAGFITWFPALEKLDLVQPISYLAVLNDGILFILVLLMIRIVKAITLMQRKEIQ